MSNGSGERTTPAPGPAHQATMFSASLDDEADHPSGNDDDLARCGSGEQLDDAGMLQGRSLDVRRVGIGETAALFK